MPTRTTIDEQATRVMIVVLEEYGRPTGARKAWVAWCGSSKQQCHTEQQQQLIADHPHHRGFLYFVSKPSASSFYFCGRCMMIVGAAMETGGKVQYKERRDDR